MSLFLHGVETIELKNGLITIQAVKSAIIGLVGIAPKGPANSLTLVQSQSDADQFGEQLTGFSIPQAIASIQAQGDSTVFVVNVFDPATMTTAVAAESVVVNNRQAKLAFAPVGTAAPVVTDATAATTYVAGTDYTIDDFGNILVLAAIGTIAEGATLKVTYAKLNGAAVTSATIIGTNNGGVRTGFKCFLDAYNQLGAKPKILIAPGYSSLNAVAVDMLSNADYYRAYALIDAPTGTTVDAAINGRGPAGTINFNTSSKRAILLEPGNMQAYDPATDSTVNRPYSAFYAGVMSEQDNTNGYWFSPSNCEIKGVLGSEIPITAAINDPNTEANALNAQGIVTVFNSGASGIRTWGNRSAAFPSTTDPVNFISVGRTADIVHESIEEAMLPFVDLPITNGVIDSIKQSVQAFINVLIGRGALEVGSAITYDPALNPPTQVAAGQLVFSLTFMPPPPLERITFNSFIDVSLLKSIGQPTV